MIIVMVTMPILQRRRKKLSYTVDVEIPLMFFEEELPEGLRLTYGGNVVREGYLIDMIFKNSGNSPIRSSDFESPLSVSISNGARVLHAEIVDPIPEDLEVKAQLTENKVVLNAGLMNSKDNFTLRLIVSEYNEEEMNIDVSGRIVGVKEIEAYHQEYKYLPSLILKRWMFYPLIIGMIAVWVLIIIGWIKPNRLVELVLLGIIMLSLIRGMIQEHL